MPSSATPLLTAAQAGFIERGLSIAVASRSARHVPSLARSFVCRVDDDRRSIRVLLVPERSVDLMRDIRACGQVAAVFVEPVSHETLQIKGSDARIEALVEGDLEHAQRCRESLAEELAKASMGPEYIRQILDVDFATAQAVRFTPAAVFVQTPGPGAGEAA